MISVRSRPISLDSVRLSVDSQIHLEVIVSPPIRITSPGVDMNTELDAAFAAFDIADLEVLDISQGMALPEMGASGGTAGTSSSSSTCSSCTC